MRVLRILPWGLAAALGGLLALSTSLPDHLPGQEADFTSVHAFWYLGRASGFLAFGLLLASVVLGLGISSRVFDGLLVRPWVFEMHQFLSVYVLIAMLFHSLILLPDPYAQFKVWELLVPFASPYRPVAVGLGAICIYGSAIVSVSFYLKRRIGQRGWRALHHASFVLFLMAMLHGIFAGTESREPWAQWTYLSSGLAVLFLTVFRILAARQAARREKHEAGRLRPPPGARSQEFVVATAGVEQS